MLTLRNGFAPLPEHWPINGRFYRRRIDLLPDWYIDLALAWSWLRPEYRAKLRAVRDLRAMARDQWEGRN